MSGRAIASGRPGSPAPEPTSIRRLPTGTSSWTAAEFSTCLLQSRPNSLGPTRPRRSPCSTRRSTNRRARGRWSPKRSAAAGGSSSEAGGNTTSSAPRPTSPAGGGCRSVITHFPVSRETSTACSIYGAVRHVSRETWPRPGTDQDVLIGGGLATTAPPGTTSGGGNARPATSHRRLPTSSAPPFGGTPRTSRANRRPRFRHRDVSTATEDTSTTRKHSRTTGVPSEGVKLGSPMAARKSAPHQNSSCPARQATTES